MYYATPTLLLWRPAETNQIGHAALLTGKYYVSFWPDGDIKQLGAKKAMSSGVKACLVTHFEADFELEEGRKPKVYPMLNVDETDLNLMIEKFLRFNGIADPEEFTLSEVKSQMDKDKDFQPKISLTRTKYSFKPTLQLINPFVMMTEDEEILRIDSEPFEWPNEAESCTSFCYHLVEFVWDEHAKRDRLTTSVAQPPWYTPPAFDFLLKFISYSPFTVDEFEFVVITFYSHTEGTIPRAPLPKGNALVYLILGVFVYALGILLNVFYASLILRWLFCSSLLSQFTIAFPFCWIFSFFGWPIVVLTGLTLTFLLFQCFNIFASIRKRNLYDRRPIIDLNKPLIPSVSAIVDDVTWRDLVESFAYSLIFPFVMFKLRYIPLYFWTFTHASAFEESPMDEAEAGQDEDSPFSNNWEPYFSEGIVQDEHPCLWKMLNAELNAPLNDDESDDSGPPSPQPGQMPKMLLKM